MTGKDHTGLAIALMLAVLGVEREGIYFEYLLSPPYVGGKDRETMATNPKLASVMTVDKRIWRRRLRELTKNTAVWKPI